MAANIVRKVASHVFRIPSSGVQAQHLQGIPNNNDPSHNTPPSIPLSASPSKDILTNILAFRTITKLLSQIQQKQAFRVSSPEKLSTPEEHLELRLSNAFSTIAVIEHEVIAVITKHTEDALKVICTTQTHTQTPTQTHTHEEPAVTLLQQMVRSICWRLMVTQNPRWSDPSALSPTAEPTISDAGTLAGIDLDDMALKQQVDEYW
jgi:hypothetical protein